MARDPSEVSAINTTLYFETPEDQEEIRVRGRAKFERGEVSKEALELGQKFKQLITSSYIPKVSVRFVNDKVGLGLFAEENLAIGSYVGEYTGCVRRNDRRYFEPMNNYCYEYPVPDEIGRSFVIDATQGNLTRLINHSFQPNLRPVHVFFDDFYHLIFVVIREIYKGDQLCYNYGTSYWSVRGSPVSI